MKSIRMRKFFLTLALAFLIGQVLSSKSAEAAPGDYSLRFKGGPSFELQDWKNQFRIGSEFDYDLGYSMGISFLALFGASQDFRFQMIPSLRYDLVYIGPASIYGLAGAGYGRFNSRNALDLRLGSGMTLPLGEDFEVNSDVNFFITPVGTPGTPVTLDWLLAFGFKFR